MATIRKYTRLVLVLAFATGMFLVRLISGRIVGVFSSRLERRMRRRLFKLGARGIVRLSGIRLEVVGHPPEPPFFLVTNHLTFLDVFVLASQTGCVFVSREDLEHWPVFGFMAREMNTIFIDRSNLRDAVRVNRLIGDAFAKGYGVAIFPESRVSQKGVVLPFKAALLEGPARLEWPVHYAAIRYETPPGGPRASEVAIWKTGVSFFDHYLKLASLPYCRATLTFGESPVRDADRKRLAAELHERVTSLYRPLD